MKHNSLLLLLSILLLGSCSTKQFYVWIRATPSEPAGISLPEGQLLVELSYDGNIHEIKAPAVAAQLSLPDDLTITFEKGSEPTAAHNGGSIGLAIDVLDGNACVVSCGTISEASCCNDTSRLSKDSPLEVQLFPIGTAGCLEPATSAGVDCRCGSGTLETGEVCDDGNVVSGDGCRSDCRGKEICGDGLVDINEECDDANTQNGDGCESNCQFSIPPVNAPVATADTFTINEDTPFTISSTSLLSNDTDVDSPVLSVAAVSNATNGIVLLSGEQITFTPTTNFNGSASFQYTVSDGALSDTGLVTVTVNPANDAPTAVDDTATINEDNNLVRTAATLLANDTDIDGDTVIFVEVSNPTNGAVSLLGDVITFSPNANFNGGASFEYTISDGSLFGTGVFTVTVNPANDPPLAVDDSDSTNEDTPLSIAASSLLANDTNVDTDALTVTGVSTSQNGAVTLNGTQILFVPSANFNGTASFDYTISDGVFNDDGKVTITVNPVNDPPVALDDIFFTAPDASLVLLFSQILANDLNVDAGNGDILSVLQLGTVTNCTVTQTANQVTLTPTVVGFRGFCTFDYTVRDAPGLIDDGFVKVAFGEFCGDALINNSGAELCDDGDLNSDTLPNACRASCLPAFCGDNITDAGEECDDGDGVEGNGCDTDCTISICGDGIILVGVETCDDGNSIEGDGCDSNCTPSGCGNGILASGEFCPLSPQQISVDVGVLKTADFNGDTVLDLIATTGVVSVFLGNGDGTFGAPSNSTIAGSFPGPFAIGDFDGDTILDLVTTLDSGNIAFLKGVGNGTFLFQGLIGGATGSGGANAVADFNGDGFLDFAFGKIFPSTIAVVLGNGNGTFGVPSNFGISGFPIDIDAADVNDDTFLDLAIANFDPNINFNAVSILLGDGSGAFGSPVNFTAGLQPSSVAVGDLNNDALLDLAVTNTNSRDGNTLLGNGNGSFGAAIRFTVGFTGSDTPNTVEMEDFNGDAFLDLVVSVDTFPTDDIIIKLGAGDGTFPFQEFITAGNGPSFIAIGDFTGDTFPDIAVANQFSNDISLILFDP
jgi:cysteine-rich repeat protein